MGGNFFISNRYERRELGDPEKARELIAFNEGSPPLEVNEKMLRLVDALRESYKVGLLSNTTKPWGAEMRERKVNEHFDAFVLSCDIGHSKPTPEAFNLFFDKLGVPAKNCIFIDDAEKSLERAEEIGFRPVLFVDYNLLLAELKDLGINLNF